MSWNYRVLKTTLDSGRPWLQVHEVYYEADTPNASTEDAINIVGSSKEELLWILDRIREAIEKAALVWDVSGNKFRDEDCSETKTEGLAGNIANRVCSSVERKSKRK